jgi:hypothetical protein
MIDKTIKIREAFCTNKLLGVKVAVISELRMPLGGYLTALDVVGHGAKIENFLWGVVETGSLL